MSFGERDAEPNVLYVSILNWYGRETIKPVCDRAKLFVALLGQKTLTRQNVEHIKELGYEVRVQTERKVL